MHLLVSPELFSWYLNTGQYLYTCLCEGVSLREAEIQKYEDDRGLQRVCGEMTHRASKGITVSEDHHKSGQRRNLKGRLCDIGAAFRGRADVAMWRKHLGEEENKLWEDREKETREKQK